MNHQTLRFLLREGVKLRFWFCVYKYFRGLIRIRRGNYLGAISDFKYILEKGGLLQSEGLVYKLLGIAYALNKDLGEAKNALFKALSFTKRPKSDSELFQWLGYVHMRLGLHGEALDYFENSFECAKRDKFNWASLLSDDYIKECVDFINKRTQEENDRILPAEN